jgi:hypothetical protein
MSAAHSPLTRQLIKDGCKPAAAFKSLRDLLDERDQAVRLLVTSSHALRSYQYGNSAPDLAEGIADQIDAFLALVEPKP